MEKREILKIVDHTVLKQTASLGDIKKIIDEGIKCAVASVCIPPSYVKAATDYSEGRLPVCTVIGFPNGYSATEVKIFEAKQAITDGATEIDTVINICDVKNGDYDRILCELNSIREVCEGKILKVIIETCMLTEEEKINLCHLVSQSGADYIKTSTGFGGGGATVEDVALMRANCMPEVKIKAAGGIRSFEDAQKLINAGASRLGTSALVKLWLEENK